MKEQPTYEPAERDPVAIRNTVIILILVMLIGGFFIVYKYKEKMGEEYEEVLKGRPAMTLGDIDKNFQVEGPGGKFYKEGFTFLENKVSLVTVVSKDSERESAVLVDVLRNAAERYAEEEKFQVVCISGDAYSSFSADELKAFCVERGGGEDWLYLTSNSDAFAKYLNRELKLGDVKRVDPETKKRVLPDITRIVDYHLNLRGKQDDFYFVARYDAEKESGRPNLHSEWQKYMYTNIDYILNHESAIEDFSKKNNSNRYHIPLIIFSGFVLFILIMGYRLKRQRGRVSLPN